MSSSQDLSDQSNQPERCAPCSTRTLRDFSQEFRLRKQEHGLDAAWRYGIATLHLMMGRERRITLTKILVHLTHQLDQYDEPPYPKLKQVCYLLSDALVSPELDRLKQKIGWTEPEPIQPVEQDEASLSGWSRESALHPSIMPVVQKSRTAQSSVSGNNPDIRLDSGQTS